MHFFNANGSFQVGSLIDQSVSTIDNVEHIYEVGLAPGIYAFDVTTDQAEAYALAWRFAAVPEPGTVALITFAAVAGFGVITYRRRRAAVAAACLATEEV